MTLKRKIAITTLFLTTAASLSSCGANSSSPRGSSSPSNSDSGSPAPAPAPATPSMNYINSDGSSIFNFASTAIAIPAPKVVGGAVNSFHDNDPTGSQLSDYGLQLNNDGSISQKDSTPLAKAMTNQILSIQAMNGSTVVVTAQVTINYTISISSLTITLPPPPSGKTGFTLTPVTLTTPSGSRPDQVIYTVTNTSTANAVTIVGITPSDTTDYSTDSSQCLANPLQSGGTCSVVVTLSKPTNPFSEFSGNYTFILTTKDQSTMTSVAIGADVEPLTSGSCPANPGNEYSWWWTLNGTFTTGQNFTEAVVESDAVGDSPGDLTCYYGSDYNLGSALLASTSEASPWQWYESEYGAYWDCESTTGTVSDCPFGYANSGH